MQFEYTVRAIRDGIVGRPATATHNDQMTFGDLDGRPSRIHGTRPHLGRHGQTLPRTASVRACNLNTAFGCKQQRNSPWHTTRKTKTADPVQTVAQTNTRHGGTPTAAGPRPRAHGDRIAMRFEYTVRAIRDGNVGRTAPLPTTTKRQSATGTDGPAEYTEHNRTSAGTARHRHAQPAYARAI